MTSQQAQLGLLSRIFSVFTDHVARHENAGHEIATETKYPNETKNVV